ncbi:chemotaxis protein CheW [Peribacillus glennii]|uniref:Chemotaxis protein CheW n=1 Tax=Peribacillus glennii TaxID=2303991 RepID=A0A372L7E5_9BACI|nr:chemotaxis protein CheW [Peribacillus glennii]RFU61130.1 chemotaxis protein CheW [Peribacillus glennii]
METAKYIVFKAGKEDFGIPVSSVISIEKMQAITELPQMPNYILGITNLRDMVVPVLDTVQILFNRRFKSTGQNRIMLVNLNGATMGVLVEEAKEILDVLIEDIKEMNGMLIQNAAYLSGVVKTDQGFVTLLNPAGLLNNLEEIEAIQQQNMQMTS